MQVLEVIVGPLRATYNRTILRYIKINQTNIDYASWTKRSWNLQKYIHTDIAPTTPIPCRVATLLTQHQFVSIVLRLFLFFRTGYDNRILNFRRPEALYTFFSPVPRFQVPRIVVAVQNNSLIVGLGRATIPPIPCKSGTFDKSICFRNPWSRVCLQVCWPNPPKVGSLMRHSMSCKRVSY